MDLERKLRFLTGEDSEYDPLPTPSEEPLRPSLHAVSDDSDDIDDLPSELSIDSYLRLDASLDTRKKKPKRSAIFDAFGDEDLEDASRHKIPKKIHSPELYAKITKGMSSDMIGDFEGYLGDDSLFDSEESDELKNGLISIGRKYARTTSATAADAEAAKHFAATEEKLKTIYDDITRDIVDVSKDINQMRAVSRGRNNKAISEMVSSKTSLHTARIQAVKEMNNIKKAQFDMQMKERSAKAAENAFGAGADISPNTFKSLFGAGRDNLIHSIGGYGTVSGARGITIGDDESNLDLSDDEIEERYFQDEPIEESEGDVYLKYEHLDPHYELVVDGAGAPIEIRGVDRDGNVLPDYPIPDIGGLRFEINSQTGTATDDLHRNYVVVQG